MKYFLSFLFLLLASSAFSASIITYDLAQNVVDFEADLVLIGSSLVGLAVVAMGIKWVKASFF